MAMGNGLTPTTQGDTEALQANDEPIIVHASMLVHGDSTKVLAEIGDASIDCIITDPPYFIDGMGSE